MLYRRFYNEKLFKYSIKYSAKFVLTRMVNYGIADNRLTAVGNGEENPIADNATFEGRKKNRRVEFTIDTPSAAEVKK